MEQFSIQIMKVKVSNILKCDLLPHFFGSISPIQNVNCGLAETDQLNSLNDRLSWIGKPSLISCIHELDSRLYMTFNI